MTTVEQLAVVDSLARARWEALAESADVAQCARKFITKCMLPHVLPFAPLTRAEERKVRSHPIVVFSNPVVVFFLDIYTCENSSVVSCLPSVGVCCRLGGGVSSLVTLLGGRTARDDKKQLCDIVRARRSSASRSAASSARCGAAKGPPSVARRRDARGLIVVGRRRGRSLVSRHVTSSSSSCRRRPRRLRVTSVTALPPPSSSRSADASFTRRAPGVRSPAVVVVVVVISDVIPCHAPSPSLRAAPEPPNLNQTKQQPKQVRRALEHDAGGALSWDGAAAHFLEWRASARVRMRGGEARRGVARARDGFDRYLSVI